ncbi:MAG: hypothetical protein DHS20C21_21810 [Gemmatimonadota bacterium]|nr:MAG: hypothetical protein DHS20C21_21810 [Gemmatimonadota bacterium]
MKITSLAMLLALPVLLSVSACGKEAPTMEEAADKASSAVSSAVEKVQNLDTEQINKFAKIAAQIEKEPAKMEAFLAEHGVSKEMFQKTLEKIQSDPNMKKMFDEAKEMAKNAM